MINVYALVDGSKLVYVGEFESITELINKGNIYEQEYKTIRYFLDADIDESVIKNHPVYKKMCEDKESPQKPYPSHARRFRDGPNAKRIWDYTFVFVDADNQYIEYHDGRKEFVGNLYNAMSVENYINTGIWVEIPKYD